MPKKKKCGGAQSATTSSTATMPIASMSLAPDPVLRDQPRGLTLFCLVLGVSDCSFPVDIRDNLTVGHLKNEIWNRKPQALASVDPDELTLWKVGGCSPFSLICPCDLKAYYFTPKHYTKGSRLSESQLKNLCLRDEGALEPVEELSSVFPDVPPGHTHVVVKAPLTGEYPRYIRDVLL